MYENVGNKIKSYVVIMTTIGIVASVIGGLCLLREPLLALLVMCAGSLISWISGLAFYGFGQMVDNTESLNELAEMRNTLNTLNATLNMLIQNQNVTIKSDSQNEDSTTNQGILNNCVYGEPFKSVEDDKVSLVDSGNGVKGEKAIPCFI